jgi:hypothetical protein
VLTFDAGAAPDRAHQLGLEVDLARLVGLAVGAGHGVGVGEVGRDDVEPLALRADRAARHVEDVQHRHGQSLTVRR